MKIAYADPPYPGCSHLYQDHPDYAGEVDHRALIERLENEFDGWVLHTHVAGLRMMERERILPEDGVRICQWVKPFAAFKPVPVLYAYEPVIIKAARKPHHNNRIFLRDWIAEPVSMRKLLPGVKPWRVCHWAFELVGAEPEDELCDLFPGSGAVMKAWRSWRSQGVLDLVEA